MNWAWITICVLGYAFLVNGCELKFNLISFFYICMILFPEVY